MAVRFRNGRKLGTIEEGYRLDARRPATISFSPASASRSSSSRTPTSSSAPRRSARGSSPTAGSACRCRPTSPTASAHMLADRNDWHRFPDDVANGSRCRRERSVLPEPAPAAGRDLPARGPALHGRLQLRRLERAPVAGHADHPADGERGPQAAGLRRQRLCARLLRARADHAIPRPLFSPDILEQEFVDWVESSYLLKTAFREVAVIGGLVERHHPGKRKSGRQVSFSTDLIYDVLRRYEPEHLLLRAAWDDARRRMTELGRLVRLVDRAAATMLHVEADADHADGDSADGHRRPRSRCRRARRPTRRC